MNDLVGSYQRLENIYRMYIKSAFPLRDRALAAERDRLLEKPALLSQPPLLETVPVYPSSGLNLDDAADSLPKEYSDIRHLAQELFPPNLTLYKHQWESLDATLHQGKDIVVTTGTGSGKTECFLLPLLGQLAYESQTWSRPNSPQTARNWWQTERDDRTVSQWEHVARPSALRAIVLYPLNALVEDQLRRLRRAIDSDPIHTWLDRERVGNRITFGRYTSMTPVPGHPNNKGKQKQLRRDLQEMAAEAREVRQQLAQGIITNQDAKWYFPNPEGSELWSRWDMQETPPDILITNYSMLNIMMMRAVEDNIFDVTRAWLAEPGHPERVFHLIIDELHAYRGTPGTEVAYIIRLLLNRLGLTPDSPKLRILTTTASLEPDAQGRKFLREFFGRDNFAFIPEDGQGHEQAPSRGAYTKMRPYVTPFAEFAQAVQPNPTQPMQPPSATSNTARTAMEKLVQGLGGRVTGAPIENDLGEILNKIDVADSLRAACFQQNGSIRPTQVPHLDDILFSPPKSASYEISDAMRGLLLATAMAKDGQNGRSPQPVRGHLFFHNLQNLWACSNPNCTDPSCDNNGRATYQTSIGALHDSHKLACSCGSRVLDFIVCEVCGELFLGGHKTDIGSGFILTADDADLERMPERVLSSQTYKKYAIFYPQPFGGNPPQKLDWTKKGTRYGWRRAKLDCVSGRLKPNDSSPPQQDEVEGWLFYVNRNPEWEPAYPTRCPNCDTDYSYRRFPTPLRSHRTGFQKACQVIAGGLLREMPRPDNTKNNMRKLVVFSDSRQDAAKLAGGMQRDHYRDLVRMALIGSLDNFWKGLLAFLQVMAQTAIPPHIQTDLTNINPKLLADIQLPLNPDMNLRAMFANQQQDLVGEIFNWWNKFQAINPDVQQQWLDLIADYPGQVPLGRLSGTIFNTLLALGVNPGGTGYRVMTYRRDNNTRDDWYNCYRWQPDGSFAPQSALTVDQSEHIRYLQGLVFNELMYALFPHTARTLEGLGQGWVSFRADNSLSHQRKQILDVVIRLLGIRRRHNRVPYFSLGNDESLPAFVRTYVEQVGIPQRIVANTLTNTGAALSSQGGLYLNPEALYLVPPPNPTAPQPGYRCPQCNAFFLHEAALTCPECNIPLVGSQTESDFDYYTYLSEESGDPFRMNCEELTGQTDKRNRVERQRWFQEIFIGNEISKVQGVDLLSVTTTMEAGVDIGSLLATMLANMPPRRFNYQQRVGRAGRRNTGVSLAVTFCRGRSHDDYYFQNPEKITGDAPPAPYVDMESEEIIRRSFIKEVLRLAFSGVPQEEMAMDSVHGEFGKAEAWAIATRPIILGWLQDESNMPLLQTVLNSLRAGTIWEGEVGDTFCQSLITFIQTNLIAEIDRIATDNSFIQTALSERLANAGLLPMFGFPTRVRLLHTRWPRADQWPPEVGVVDRDLDIAIGQFAPGSQTVKDKAVHTACGVVEFYPKGRREMGTRPGFAPALAEVNDKMIGICSNCRAVALQASMPQLFPQTQIRGGDSAPIVSCPVCNTADMRVIDAREPKNFITDFMPEDFEGQFEWQPSSTQPTLSFHNSAHSQLVKNTQVASFSDFIISVNDNGGEGGFDFREATVARDGGGRKDGVYVVEPRSQQAVTPVGESYRIALMSRRKTDILLASMGSWGQGIFADPTEIEGRAAWYSFAFWLRKVAGIHLDVDPQELRAGFRTVEVGGVPNGEAFLSDSLENGAGYCTLLGQVQEFEQLLAQADPTQQDSVAMSWLQAPHGDNCDASCPICLRDYGNMSYHGLLDWRLALDMARLAYDPQAAVDLTSHWGAFANPWQQTLTHVIPKMMQKLQYNNPTKLGHLQVYIHTTAPKLWLVVHPLWQADHPLVQGAVKLAKGQNPNYQIGFLNPFRALRRPADYV